MKKIIALLLAVMMLVTLVACTKAPADTTTKGVSNDTTAAPAADDTTAAPADDSTGEIVTVKWVTSNGEAGNYDSWVEKINAYAGPKIGVNIEMIHVDGDTLKLMYQTGADYDIIFAPAGDFTNNVNLGAAAALEDLLPQVPALTELIPQYVFDAVTVNGHVYGIPAYKDVSHSEFFVWADKLVQEYYPEYTEVHTIEDVYNACVTIKERGLETDNAYIMKSSGSSLPVAFEFDGLDLNLPIGIDYEGGTEFVSTYETDEVKNELYYMDKLYHEGFINSDCYVVDSTESDEFLLGNAQGWPDARITAWLRYGEPTQVSQCSFTKVSTDSCRGSVLVINAASTKQLEALKWIELVNTDTWVRDMYWYGEEGVQWEYTEEDGVKKIHKLDTDISWTYWAYMYGTFFTATPEEGQNGYAQIQAQNEEAVVSPAMGFTYDRTETADIIANLQAIWSSYSGMINQGVDISLVDTALSEMYDAGFQTLIDDVNAQFSAWKAAN